MIYRISPYNSPLKRREAGNIFFMLFGAVALVGAIGAATMSNMKGIATSMSEVTRKEVAEQKMTGGARLSIQAATSVQANAGDCDLDGWVEPLPFKPAAGAPAPVGGGLIPDGIGAEQRDPWGSLYGYCVWDGGAASKVAGCGGAGANRLAGSPSGTGHPIVAIISAGKDRKFQTSCNAYVDTTPADGNPDTPLIGRVAGGDDIIMEYSYNDASGLSSDDLWKIRDTDPTIAMIDKNIEVTGGGQFGGALNLMSAGLVLPADPGNNSVTSACNAQTDQQLRVNIGTSPPSFEICHGNAWEPVSFGGNDGSYDEPTEVIKLIPEDGGSGDEFGREVEVYGDTIVIASWKNSQAAAAAGAIYIYKKSNGIWIQSQKLIASDATSDSLGQTLSFDGKTIIAGAPTKNGNRGAAYIFEKNAGFWQEKQKIVADDVAAADNFGCSVGVANNTIIVGSCRSDALGNDSGAAYVFTKSGGSWIQTQKLLPSDGGPEDRFSEFKLSLTDNVAAIGSRYDDDGEENSGAVYIFTKSGNSWTQTQKLKASDITANAEFGRNVSFSGNTLAISAPLGSSGGAAYIFTKSGNSWTQTQKIVAPDAGVGPFAHRSELYGDTLIINDRRDNQVGVLAGAIYLYKNNGGLWTFDRRIVPSDLQAGDEFGMDISLHKDIAVIGARGVDNIASNAGAAYVYEGMGAKTSRYASTTPPTGWYIKGLMKNSNFLGCRSAGRGPFTLAGQSDATANSIGLAVGNNIYSAGGTSFSAFNRISAVINRDRTQTAGSDMQSVWISGMFSSMLTSSPSSNILRAWTYTPGSLNNVATYTGTGNIGYVWSDKTYVYTAGAAGVRAYSYNGSTFTPLATFDELSTGNTIWGDGKFIYVTDTNGMLYVLAFNGTSFSLISSISFGGTPTKTYGDGRYIYIATNVGLYVMAFDGEQLSEVFYSSTPTNLTAIWGDGANVYVGDSAGNIRALSYTGTGLKTYATYKMEATASITDIQGDGNYLYVAQGSNPVSALSGFSCGASIAPNPAVVLAANKYSGKISLAQGASCGIKEDSTVWCWGVNTNGRLGNGALVNSNTPKAITSDLVSNSYTMLAGAGTGFCGLHTNGTTWCWGSGFYGTIGNGTTINNQETPAQVLGGHIFTRISGGANAYCAIRTDGTAWCWGRGTEGQIGNGAAASQSVPTQVTDVGPWVDIATRSNTSCGIKVDGSAWCWGTNVSGSLGIGDLGVTSSNIPLPIAEPGPWVKISVGGSNFACGLKLDGTAWCWGNAALGKLGNGTTENSAVPVRISDSGPWIDIISSYSSPLESFACAIKIDGSAWCWGPGANGRLGNNATNNALYPARVSDPGPWATISLGGDHGCGIKVDGSAWCWGSDSTGHLGNGAATTVDQLVPSRVYNFSNAEPWQWDATQTGMTKAVSTAPVIIPPTSAIGYDANSGGLSFTGTGTTVLRRINGDVEFAIDTTVENTSAQLSFDAQDLANAATIGIDYQNGNLEFFRNTGTASNWSHGVNPTIFITPQGNIGLGNGTVANARLDLSLTAQGGLKISDDTRECTPSRQGTIKYTANAFYFCDGTAWVAL